jgi:DNA-binding LytR/AlgR family response regulator
VPVVTSRIGDHLFAVVSVNAFEGVDQSLLRHTSASLDGEGTESRLARRKRDWIANVKYIESATSPVSGDDA